jgi:hypothetical protein
MKRQLKRKNQYHVNVKFRDHQNLLQEKQLQVKSDSAENVLREITGQFTNIEKCSIISYMNDNFTAKDGNTTAT